MPTAASANVYVESSAVLTWIFGQPQAPQVLSALGTADRVLTSEITLVESLRGLIRGEVMGEYTAAKRSELEGKLRRRASAWDVVYLDETVLERASRPFPNEPVRTLDAIHLATALLARSTVPDLSVISLDHRIRTAAAALGFEVLP